MRFDFPNIYLPRRNFELRLDSIINDAKNIHDNGLLKLVHSYFPPNFLALNKATIIQQEHQLDYPEFLRIKCVPLITNGVWFMYDVGNCNLIFDYLDTNCVDYDNFYKSILRTNIRTLCNFFSAQLNSTEVELTLGIKNLNVTELVDRLGLLISRIGLEFDNQFEPIDISSQLNDSGRRINDYTTSCYIQYKVPTLSAAVNFKLTELQDLYVYTYIPIRFKNNTDIESRLVKPCKYPLLWFSKYWFKEEIKRGLSFGGGLERDSIVANILRTRGIFGEIDIY